MRATGGRGKVQIRASLALERSTRARVRAAVRRTQAELPQLDQLAKPADPNPQATTGRPEPAVILPRQARAARRKRAVLPARAARAGHPKLAQASLARLATSTPQVDPAARAGTVTSFDTDGGYLFTLDTDASAAALPDQGGIMLVRQSVPGHRGDTARASSDARPGSPGLQSYVLNEDYNYYWDAYYRDIDESTDKRALGRRGPGDPFGGASVSGGVRLGVVASDRFAAMRQSPCFEPDTLDLVIGGQAGHAGRQQEIEANATEHDTVALAPYFGILDAWSSEAEIYPPLFANPEASAKSGAMGQRRDYLTSGGDGTRLGIYEISFHTTGGDAPEDVRNEFVAGRAGAIALPLHMLTYQTRLGAIDQCAFSILQHSLCYQRGSSFHDHRHVRLWGMLRDLHGTRRKRPTWLGVETVNRAIMGDALVTEQTGDNPAWTQTAINGIAESTSVRRVQSFAYRDGETLGLAFSRQRSHDA